MWNAKQVYTGFVETNGTQLYYEAILLCSYTGATRTDGCGMTNLPLSPKIIR